MQIVDGPLLRVVGVRTTSRLWRLVATHNRKKYRGFHRFACGRWCHRTTSRLRRLVITHNRKNGNQSWNAPICKLPMAPLYSDETHTFVSKPQKRGLLSRM